MMRDRDLFNVGSLDESLANAIGLNEELSNCCALDGGDYSNLTNMSLVHGLSNESHLEAEGGGVDAKTVEQGADAVTKIIGAVSSNKSSSKQELKSVCGRRPLFKGRKRNDWNDCVDRYEKQKNAPKVIVKTAPKPKPKPVVKVDDKILGMPKGLAIVAGIFALGIFGVVAVKVIKKVS